MGYDQVERSDFERRRQRDQAEPDVEWRRRLNENFVNHFFKKKFVNHCDL